MTESSANTIKINTEDYPLADGFYMPAEFSPHDGTIMIYPTRPGSWGKDRSGALASFGMIYREIAKREKLFLIADKAHYDEAREFAQRACGDDNENLHMVCIESDDAWARDVGPTFVVDRKGGLRAVNWSFNAWGGETDGLYASWDKDDRLAEKFCEYYFASRETAESRAVMYDAAPFVLEGGSIHSDGEGTVIVTSACLLSKGRNPELSQAEIEDRLKKYLGAEKVLWLPRGIYNDETNEHVDNVCAFTAPSEVVLAWTDNETDPQYELSRKDLEYLESVTDAKGRRLKIHKLPIPDYPITVTETDLANYEFEEGEDMREVGERLAASYVNYYYINGAVLVPQFGGANTESDIRAVEILKGLCPRREVIGIPARDILLGGGNIHCVTQQIPERL